MNQKSNFKVFTISPFDEKDADKYVRWSKGLELYIKKDDKVILLDENEILELIKCLPKIPKYT